MPLDETSIAGYVGAHRRARERGRRLQPPRRARPTPSAAPSTRSRATAPSRCWWCRCGTTRTRSSASSSSSTRSATARRCSVRSRWSTSRSSPSPRWTEELVDVARQPGRGGLREHRPDPGHPEALRRVRARLGDRDRAARPHDLGPLRAGRRCSPWASPRRSTPIDIGRSPTLRFTPRPAPGDPLRRLLHDFGKVGVREKVLVKGKKLYAARCSRSGSASPTSQAHRGRPPAGQARARSQPGAPRREPLAATRARSTQAGASEADAILAGDPQGQRAHGPGGGELPRAHGPARAHFATSRPRTSSRSRTWAQAPFLTADEVDGALDPEGQPVREQERQEIESHVTHTYEFLLQDPVDRRVAPASPRSPTRTTRSSTAPGYPRGLRPPTDPRPVADDDDRRHLRRPGRLGPPLQEGGLGGAGPRHPERGGRRTGSSTTDLLRGLRRGQGLRAARRSSVADLTERRGPERLDRMRPSSSPTAATRPTAPRTPSPPSRARSRSAPRSSSSTSSSPRTATWSSSTTRPSTGPRPAAATCAG